VDDASDKVERRMSWEFPPIGTQMGTFEWNLSKGVMRSERLLEWVAIYLVVGWIE